MLTITAIVRYKIALIFKKLKRDIKAPDHNRFLPRDDSGLFF